MRLLPILIIYFMVYDSLVDNPVLLFSYLLSDDDLSQGK